jgi:UDP-glucose 4-epimerase/UDP-glucuronate decarboxylase
VKILVTGAAGFLGYHTAKRLATQGHELTLVDDFSRYHKDDQFMELASKNTSFQVDLLHDDGWDSLGDQFDAVYHFAAINGTRHFYEQPSKVLEVNCRLVTALLDWHKRIDSKSHIIWMSSSEVYAGVKYLEIPTSETTPVGITDVFNPRYSYAVSKVMGEMLIINRARDQSLQYTIIRPHNIFGPRMGNDHVIPEFSLRIKNREQPFRIYGGDETRSFCYVSDFVDGLVSLLGSASACGQVINLGDDRNEIPIRDLAQQMFRLTNWHPDMEIMPAPEGSVARRKPCLDKARRLLAFQPKIDLDEALLETYKWYDEH